MTKSTNKPKRHPTFTLDELRITLEALTHAIDNDEITSSYIDDAMQARDKIGNAIAYREYQQREVAAHGERTRQRDQAG